MENFTNESVSIGKIAKLEEASFEPLERNYRRLSLIYNAFFWSVLLIGGLVFLLLQKPGYWEIGIGVVIAIYILAITSVWFYLKAAVKQMAYSLRERDISFKQGLFWRSMVTVPFNRVQHCEVSRSFFERKLGLASLKVYTAGQGKSDLVLPGLTPDTADKLKDFIIKRASDA